MADQSYLSWPFFEDSHRELAARLGAWASSEMGVLRQGDDEDASCRALVSALGRGEWLRYVVPWVRGDALDVRSLCLIRERLAYEWGLADFAFAMQGLGSAPIGLYGCDDLKTRYLARVGAGDAIAAFALSEDEAGSNVAAIETKAVPDGDAFVLDGGKTWISNAGIADFYVVFARTGEGPGHKGLSAFVLDAGLEGLSVTERITVTSPHPLGSLRFAGCRVPRDNMLGEPGEGFKIAMGTLDAFRSTVGAAAVGFARRALDEALAWTKDRVVFERPLSEFQMTREKIANMATEIDASAALVYRAAWAKDTGAKRVAREASMAKMYATEAAQRVIDAAVQLFGGRGVTMGTVVEQLYRDIRPLRIYEGTTEIQKLVIAREVLKEQEKQKGN